VDTEKKNMSLNQRIFLTYWDYKERIMDNKMLTLAMRYRITEIGILWVPLENGRRYPKLRIGVASIDNNGHISDKSMTGFRVLTINTDISMN
jgi:hypothetical protein